MTSMKFAVALCFGSLALAGCDMATEMAGEAILGDARERYIEQCEQYGDSFGIATERLAEACECSADNFIKNASDGNVEIDQGKIEEVLKTCVREQLGQPAETPAEANNG